MSPVGRLRQVCPRVVDGRLSSCAGLSHRRSASTHALTAGDRYLAMSTGAPREAEDNAASTAKRMLAPNQVLLGGVIAGEPERSSSISGDPTTVLLIAFQEPGETDHWGASCSEVEVLDSLIEGRRHELRAGASCFLTGELMGSGCIWAHLVAVDEFL